MIHPPVTVIVCARNAADQLPLALAGFHRQSYPPAARSLLVVDNGSTDSTAAVAAGMGAVVLPCATPGVSHARQAGWRAATTPLVAYLDADCDPPTDWLAKSVARLQEDPRLAAVGSRLIEARTTNLAEIHSAAQGVLNTDFFWTRTPWQMPFVATAALVLRREALVQAGGFDTSLGRRAGEDADLCWRMRGAGWRLAYDRTIAVRHHHRTTISAMLRQIHWYGRGSAALFARWRPQLGHQNYVNPKPYLRLLRAVVSLPLSPFQGDRYKRMSAALRVADSIAHLAGKWRGAWENRVWFL